jgi:nudix-type nucleoside diphosphatase (YffH/AdpP family)
LPPSPIRILKTEILSDDWARLTKYTFERRHRDGAWHSHVHQAYDRGNGVVVLPHDPDRGTVLLVRQFRLPVFLNGGPSQAGPSGNSGGDGMLIEACAGLLDVEDPEAGIRREAEEELGYRLRELTQIFDLFTSPGSVTERIIFFTARYSPADRVFAGGGAAHEGEDIEVLEMGLTQALAMAGRGEIRDAKTILLLQHLKLQG